MKMFEAEGFLWRIFLAFIFLRPFISEYAFLSVGLWYSLGLVFICVIYLVFIIRNMMMRSRLDYFPFIFLIAVMLSALSSRYPRFVFFEIYLFLPNILVFYIVSKIDALQQKELVNTIFFSAAIICVYSIYQYFFGFSHTMQYLKTHEPNVFAEEFLSRKRVYGTFITPNMLASYIIMIFFVGMGQALSKGSRYRLIQWVLISLMLIALILTRSMGGILTIAIVLVLFLWFSVGLKSLTTQRIILVLASLTSIFLLIYGLFIRDRLTAILSLNNPDNSLVQRLYYWRTSLSVFWHYPLTGVGWRQLGSVYIFFKPLPANISNYSHNVFLQVLAETGTVGFLAFLGIVFAFLKRGARIIKGRGQGRWFKICLFCAGIGFLVHNLVDLSFYFGQVSLFWWIILGLFVRFSSDNSNAAI